MKLIRVSLVATLFLLSHAATGHISEEVFEGINNSIIKIHAPLIESKLNAQLILLELWHDYGGAFKVDSARKPAKDEYIITLTGDIPQNQFMEADGYAIVACHEMGHLLGGSPLQTSGHTKWSSVEGQADYYATNECMWSYIRAVRPNKNIKIDLDVFGQCHAAHEGNFNKVFGCVRIISGIVAMQNYFNDTSSKNKPVDYRQKDETKVERTKEKYPSNQCRIDTMMAGVLNQARPSCWFAG